MAGGAAACTGLVDPRAGLVVLGAAAVGLAWARLTWWREIEGFDRLQARARRASAAEADALADALPPVAAHFAGELAHALRGLHAQTEQVRLDGERAARMIEAAPNGVAVIGADDRIVLMNPAMREMVAPRREPVGMKPVEAVPLPELMEVLDGIRGGAALVERESTVGPRDLVLSAVPMGDEVLILVRDVTRAARAARARTEFVANVSHELRTPIAAVRGFAELLLDDADRLPEDAVALVGKVHANTLRLNKLFDDLLHLYRIEARRRELPRERFRLAPVLAEAVAVAADRAAQKGLDFALEVDEAVEVWTHREALSAMVANLASNGCKYTPEGGSVRVWTTVSEDAVEVRVTDTGIGIPTAHHERVFERFYRVDEGRSRRVGGTGLGLAIVKHLAQASGCTLELQSQEGEGSTFTVKVPRRAPETGAPTWDATLPSGSP